MLKAVILIGGPQKGIFVSLYLTYLEFIILYSRHKISTFIIRYSETFISRGRFTFDTTPHRGLRQVERFTRDINYRILSTKFNRGIYKRSQSSVQHQY